MCERPLKINGTIVSLKVRGIETIVAEFELDKVAGGISYGHIILT
jgi:hypothetical protein